MRRHGLILVLGCAAGAGCGADFPVGPEAGAENVRVNHLTSFAHQEEPSIAMDKNGRLFVGWKEMHHPAGVDRVAFARSLDGGFTWSEPTLMDRLNDGGQSDPWLVVDASGDLIYAQLNACGILVSRSEDAGAAWSAPTCVHDRSGAADKESLASDGHGRLYLASVNMEQDSVAIILSASQDRGRSWRPTTVVSKAAGWSQAPVVAALPEGHVYAAWWSLAEGNVRISMSSDFGVSWGESVRVNPVPGSVPDMPSPGSYPLFPPFPAIAVSATGTVFVAWPDHGSGDWDVLVSRSDDQGQTWSSPVPVSDSATGNQWMIRLEIDTRDVLHAAWYDSRTGDTHVMYASSGDGRTWSPSLRVTTVATPGSFNRLGDYLGLAVGTDGVARIVWTDARGPDLDIYFASAKRPLQ